MYSSKSRPSLEALTDPRNLDSKIFVPGELKLSSPFSEHVAWFFNNIYNVKFPNGQPRGDHSILHVTRGARLIPIQINLRRLYNDTAALAITEDQIQLAMITFLGHDCARMNGGTDLWDNESAHLTYYYLTKVLGVDEETASAMAAAIAKKDTPSADLVTQLVGDSDRFEIKRLLDEKAFDPQRLRIYQTYQGNPKAVQHIMKMLTEIDSLLERQGDHPRKKDPLLKARYEDPTVDLAIVADIQHSCPFLFNLQKHSKAESPVFLSEEMHTKMAVTVIQHNAVMRELKQKFKSQDEKKSSPPKAKMETKSTHLSVTQRYLHQVMKLKPDQRYADNSQWVDQFLDSEYNPLRVEFSPWVRQCLAQAMDVEQQHQAQWDSFVHGTPASGAFLYAFYTALNRQLRGIDREDYQSFRFAEDYFNTIKSIPDLKKHFAAIQTAQSALGTDLLADFQEMVICVNCSVFGCHESPGSASYRLFILNALEGWGSFQINFKKILTPLLRKLGFHEDEIISIIAELEDIYQSYSQTGGHLYQILVNKRATDALVYPSQGAGYPVGINGGPPYITSMRDAIDKVSAGQFTRVDILEGRMYLSPQYMHQADDVKVITYTQHPLEAAQQNAFNKKLADLASKILVRMLETQSDQWLLANKNPVPRIHFEGLRSQAFPGLFPQNAHASKQFVAAFSVGLHKMKYFEALDPDFFKRQLPVLVKQKDPYLIEKINQAIKDFVGGDSYEELTYLLAKFLSHAENKIDFLTVLREFKAQDYLHNPALLVKILKLLPEKQCVGLLHCFAESFPNILNLFLDSVESLANSINPDRQGLGSPNALLLLELLGAVKLRKLITDAEDFWQVTLALPPSDRPAWLQLIGFDYLAQSIIKNDLDLLAMLSQYPAFGRNLLDEFSIESLRKILGTVDFGKNLAEALRFFPDEKLDFIHALGKPYFQEALVQSHPPDSQMAQIVQALLPDELEPGWLEMLTPDSRLAVVINPAFPIADIKNGDNHTFIDTLNALPLPEFHQRMTAALSQGWFNRNLKNGQDIALFLFELATDRTDIFIKLAGPVMAEILENPQQLAEALRNLPSAEWPLIWRFLPLPRIQKNLANFANLKIVFLNINLLFGERNEKLIAFMKFFKITHHPYLDRLIQSPQDLALICEPLEMKEVSALFITLRDSGRLAKLFSNASQIGVFIGVLDSPEKVKIFIEIFTPPKIFKIIDTADKLGESLGELSCFKENNHSQEFLQIFDEKRLETLIPDLASFTHLIVKMYSNYADDTAFQAIVSRINPLLLDKIFATGGKNSLELVKGFFGSAYGRSAAFNQLFLEKLGRICLQKMIVDSASLAFIFSSGFVVLAENAIIFFEILGKEYLHSIINTAENLKNLLENVNSDNMPSLLNALGQEHLQKIRVDLDAWKLLEEALVPEKLAILQAFLPIAPSTGETTPMYGRLIGASTPGPRDRPSYSSTLTRSSSFPS